MTTWFLLDDMWLKIKRIIIPIDKNETMSIVTRKQLLGSTNLNLYLTNLCKGKENV